MYISENIKVINIRIILYWHMSNRTVNPLLPSAAFMQRSAIILILI